MPTAYLLPEFNLWREGYAGATVAVYESDGTTLASLFYDTGASSAAPNPITLSSTTISGKSYGRYPQPIYTTAASYFVRVTALGSTGLFSVPLASFVGADASNAVVTVPDGNPTALAALFGTSGLGFVSVQAYGQLATNETTANNALLTTCIGIAAGIGGGRVLVPPGTWAYDHLGLPARVILAGAGEDVTTLVSTYADDATIKPSGAGAGIEDITLDGQNLVANSVGLDLDGKDGFVIRRARLKRFEKGIKQHGGADLHLLDFDLENCATGIEAWSDDDNGAVTGLTWRGGSLTDCTTMGLQLKDDTGDGMRWTEISGVEFKENLGTAIELWGAQFTSGARNTFAGNAKDINIRDNTDLTPNVPTLNTKLRQSSFKGGKISVTDTNQNTILEECRFETHIWDIQLPKNSLLLVDAIETSDVSVTGDTTRIQRRQRFDEGGTKVRTTSNAAEGLVIWSAELEPGQTAMVEALITANGENNIEAGGFVVRGLAKRAAANLLFDNQTANFVVGGTIKGVSSGASGLLVGLTDNGSSGTLQLRRIVGEFQDNETLTSTSGGSALANGVLSYQPVTVTGKTNDFKSATSDGLSVSMVGSANEVQVTVVGLANKWVEWGARVQMQVST